MLKFVLLLVGLLGIYSSFFSGADFERPSARTKFGLNYLPVAEAPKFAPKFWPRANFGSVGGRGRATVHAAGLNDLPVREASKFAPKFWPGANFESVGGRGQTRSSEKGIG